MPRLEPFAAVRFHTAQGGDVSPRIAPPYDVLDEGPKQALLDRDAHNIVAVDLPVTPPKTVGPDAAYEQAGETYRQWLADGVLTRDEKPAVYAYEQRYIVAGRPLARRGLFATLGLEDFNQPHGIYRHEMTIQGGIDDRYKLMAATKAQLSPIFGVFGDPDKQVANLLAEQFEQREPDFQGTTANDDVVHRVWRVADPGTLTALQDYFRQTEVFIADGHHRYTTALKFHRDHPELPAAGNCLFDLVAAEDEGMIVLPTHRVITGLDGLTVDDLSRRIAGRDDIRLMATEHGPDHLDQLAAELEARPYHAMGLYDPASKMTFVLLCTGPDPLADLLPDKPEVWRTLDVAILQHLITDTLFKPAYGGGGDLTYKYTADADEVRTLCDADPAHRLGVLMQFTPLESVMAVSLTDEVMPAKSTYFYPKLATGLVINPLT